MAGDSKDAGTLRGATAPTPPMTPAKPNPLLEIAVTIVLPGVVLMLLSGADRLGPAGALVAALALPVGWGLWDGWRRRAVNWLALASKIIFRGKHVLHLVEGIDLHSVNSFPSGHSASAFALFLCLTIIIKNKALQPIFFTIACLVAYSRVYLRNTF